MKENLNRPSVYQIRNLKNDKVYIGSATNTRTRWGVHRHRLRKGNHFNRNLQKEWDEYGEPSFIFEILEWVDLPDLRRREGYWIESSGCCFKGYNIASNPYNNKGIVKTPENRAKCSASHKGKKIPLAAIQKAIETKKRNGNSGARKGYHHTEKTRARMSRTHRDSGIHQGSSNNRAIRDESIVRQVILLLIEQKSPEFIAGTLGVPRKFVSSVNRRSSWSHVTVPGYENVEVYYEMRKMGGRKD